MTTTMELEEAVDTPDLDDENGGGDRDDAFLIVYKDGALEVVELQGSDDEGISADDLVERFDNAVKAGKPFLKLGRRRILLSDVRSFGPEDEVDYPEVSVFGNMEERAERLHHDVAALIAKFRQIAQSVAWLVEQQGSLQQAQAQLFDAIRTEEILEGEGETAGPLVPEPLKKNVKLRQGGKSSKGALKIPGASKQ